MGLNSWEGKVKQINDHVSYRGIYPKLIITDRFSHRGIFQKQTITDHFLYKGIFEKLIEQLIIIRQMNAHYNLGYNDLP